MCDASYVLLPNQLSDKRSQARRGCAANTSLSCTAEATPTYLFLLLSKKDRDTEGAWKWTQASRQGDFWPWASFPRRWIPALTYEIGLSSHSLTWTNDALAWTSQTSHVQDPSETLCSGAAMFTYMLLGGMGLLACVCVREEWWFVRECVCVYVCRGVGWGCLGVKERGQPCAYFRFVSCSGKLPKWMSYTKPSGLW